MKLFLLRCYLIILHIIDLNIFYFMIKYISDIDLIFGNIPLIFKLLSLYIIYKIISWVIRKSEVDKGFESLIEKELSENDIQDRN